MPQINDIYNYFSHSSHKIAQFVKLFSFFWLFLNFYLALFNQCRPVSSQVNLKP